VQADPPGAPGAPPDATTGWAHRFELHGARAAASHAAPVLARARLATVFRAPPTAKPSHGARSLAVASSAAAASDAAGLGGALLLPQSFGAIHLGETFVSYVSVANFSSRTATAVGIKAELQTEKTRAVLFDNTAAPLARLAPGERHDVLVEADLKVAGPHTLVCSTVYTDADGERKYLPQARARACPCVAHALLRLVRLG
jgi:hypothetical protein